MARAITSKPPTGAGGSRAPEPGRGHDGPVRAPIVSNLLALQQTAGNAAVTRMLARKSVTVHLATPPPVKRRSWIERASPENEGRARKLDELEKLTDDKITKLREDVTAKAMGPASSDQETAMRVLENIESITADRGIAPRAERRALRPLSRRPRGHAHERPRAPRGGRSQDGLLQAGIEGVRDLPGHRDGHRVLREGARPLRVR